MPLNKYKKLPEGKPEKSTPDFASSFHPKNCKNAKDSPRIKVRRRVDFVFFKLWDKYAGRIFSEMKALPNNIKLLTINDLGIVFWAKVLFADWEKTNAVVKKKKTRPLLNIAK